MIGRMLYHLNFPSEKIFVQSEMHTIKWETNQPIKFNSAENGLIMDYIRLVRSTNDEHVAFFGRRRSIPKSPPQNVDLNRLGRLLSGYWRHLWTFPFFPFKFIELPPFPRLFFCFRRRIEWNIMDREESKITRRRFEEKILRAFAAQAGLFATCTVHSHGTFYF